MATPKTADVQTLYRRKVQYDIFVSRVKRRKEEKNEEEEESCIEKTFYMYVTLDSHRALERKGRPFPKEQSPHGVER